MPASFVSILFSALLIRFAASATLEVSVSTTAPLTGQPVSAVSENSVTVNLGDRSGLIPGRDILVTLGSAPDSTASWGGGFFSGTGPGTAELSHRATLSLMIGTFSVSREISWSNLFPPDVGGSGFTNGPAFAPFPLLVPWDAPLEQLQFRLSQVTVITGSQAWLDGAQSNISSGALTLSSVTVPEPLTGPALFALTALLCRRWRAA